jgi:hypothetical protein
MKVIFLDIDGVINSKAFLENNRPFKIDRENVLLLKELIEKTGAVLVLSSGWKSYFDKNMNPVSEEAVYLENTLNDYGIKLYDKTPDFSTLKIRLNKEFSKVKAREIKAWLKCRTDIENYIIIDDLLLNDEKIDNRLLRTDNTVGITKSDIEMAIHMLE